MSPGGVAEAKAVRAGPAAEAVVQQERGISACMMKKAFRTERNQTERNQLAPRISAATSRPTRIAPSTCW